MTYPIPLEALDDRLAFVGMTGSGKTYNAGTAVERLLPRARAVICDPLGVWWGLRLKADGETPAFPVVVFGGQHGDLPLTERAGAVIGEAAATMAESCIIDLSEIETAAGERRFMLGFLRALYQHATGEPVHLVLDEADMWAPQTIRDKEGDATKLFAITERIVRRGRVAGFIPWLITQRPAEISKSVLSMVDGLIAMTLTSPQDRNALDAWISGQADMGQGAQIKDAMPALPLGQGVVWIPRRGILAPQASFPKKETFDSSATPKRGERRQDVVLRPLDLGKLRERLATVEEDVKLSDPRALKTEIIRLKGELAKAGASPAMLEQAEAAAYARGHQHGARSGQRHMLTRVQAAIEQIGILGLEEPPENVQEVTVSAALTSPSPKAATPPAPAPASAAPPTRANPAAKKLLDALMRYPDRGLTWNEACAVAGILPGNGYFYGGRKALLENNVLREEQGRLFPRISNLSPAHLTRTDFKVLVRSRQAPAPRMFEVVCDAGGKWVPIAELAETLGVIPRNGFWYRGLSVLRDAALIEQTDAGVRVIDLIAEASA